MFSISYKLTEEEDLIATLGYYRTNQKKKKRVLFIFLLFSIPLALYFLYSFFLSVDKNFIALTPTLTLLIVLYSSYMFKKDISNKHKLNFKQRKDANKVIHIELGNDRIVFKVDGFTSTDISWDDIVKSVIIKEGIFLHLTTSSYYWMPVTGFLSEKIYKDAYGFVKSKIENVKDFR